MNEKLIERKLKKGVKKLGGKALKFSSPFETGWPDRQVILPVRQVYWVELKSTGKKQSKRQVVVARELKNLGFEVYVLDDEKKLNDFLNLIAQ
jgi:hypothetical protein